MIEDDSEEQPPHHDIRARLIVEVLVFQLKLAADGIRDLMMMPVSIVAAIAGLVAGGEHPEVYFRRVQQFGRRSELWINLFGHRRRGNTADELVRPLEETLLAQMRRGGRLDRGAKHVNQMLDNVNQKQKRTNAPSPENPDGS
jgi:hypothetical protein